ncbi:MAG: response regulator [Gammaproteobacteria bacterium]|nr:response regulator [Gammaproteobacteria bacterium]MBT3489624.1 response regulator [Gammaproteobacteria bacterium]MBT3718462.1 response regulator [Gammaproteobacteria bacterium]MBT3843939.1 response regulator [Gammaproteobacteria bacterium]MBT3893437.1 response regulator [Gammaproteobacteria bacterium]
MLLILLMVAGTATYNARQSDSYIQTVANHNIPTQLKIGELRSLLSESERAYENYMQQPMQNYGVLAQLVERLEILFDNLRIAADHNRALVDLLESLSSGASKVIAEKELLSSGQKRTHDEIVAALEEVDLLLSQLHQQWNQISDIPLSNRLVKRSANLRNAVEQAALDLRETHRVNLQDIIQPLRASYRKISSVSERIHRESEVHGDVDTHNYLLEQMDMLQKRVERFEALVHVYDQESRQMDPSASQIMILEKMTSDQIKLSLSFLASAQNLYQDHYRDEMSEFIDQGYVNQVIFMILSLGAVLLVLIGAYFSYHILNRPINDLIQYSEEIADGQFSRYQHRNNVVEFSKLFSAFEQMSRHLQQKQSELEEHIHQLEVSSEAVIRAGQVKDDFLASMSHELRTPLTSIIGNSDYLIDQETDAEKQDVLIAIETAGKAQLALVNDVLDMSKIESGKFSIDTFPYDLARMLKNVEDVVSIRAQDAGLSLEIKQEGREEYQLLGDANRIKQILTNMLTNAVKFTEQGDITLTCWHDNDSLYFRVDDTGIGMSEETLKRSFDRFEQADRSISRKFGGSGLGLFISTNLAEMMGGKITASSEVGVGSAFLLTIPYRQSDTPVNQSKARETALLEYEEKFTGEVLIAEDTPELQLLERRILERCGVTVQIANDGVEVVRLVEQHRFDLILMDMQMPNMDGIEATRLLRERNNRTPIVALTANVMQKHRDAFRQAGCDGFLSKPIDRLKLRETLKRFLVAAVDIEVLESAEKPDQRIKERKATDTGKEENNRRSYHRRVRGRVQDAANQRHPDADEFVDDELMAVFGESVVKHRADLESALLDKDWDKIKEVAHPIKGSGTSFGFPVLTEKARLVCDAYDNEQPEDLPDLTRHLIDELNKALS